MANEVDAWMAVYDNPMKDVVQAIREAILAADPRIEETIKWKAPTFTYKGNMASFFPKSKAHASLMFHKGAEIPGDFPILEGDGKETRTMKIRGLDDLRQNRGQIEAIARAWCDMRDAS